MTSNQKSVGLAAGVVIATLALICILTQANRVVANPEAGHQHAHQDQPQIGHKDHAPRGKLAKQYGRPGLPATPRLEARGKMTAEEGRQRYAATLGQRMGKRQKITVSSEGPRSTTLKMAWPAEGPGTGHIETLKRAKPLFAELKGRGYSKLSCWIGKKEVWSKEL